MMDLRFWRWPQQRRAASSQREWDDQTEWTASMITRGWHHWMYSPPPAILTYSPIEMTRREWPMTRIGAPRDVPPETNTNGLWWRRCGGAEIDWGSAA